MSNITMVEESAPSLAPPMQLEVGAIVTVKMRGHTRSPNQQDYYAPAVVLMQYDDQFGSIDALVWDSSAGTHFANGYHVRELATTGDGAERRTIEKELNIGQVLFSPHAFTRVCEDVEDLRRVYPKVLDAFNDLQHRVKALELEAPNNKPATPKAEAGKPVAPTVPDKK